MRVQRVQEIWLKIKTLADEALGEWGVFALILLVSLGSFGLGRLSALEAQKPLIRLQEAPQTASAGAITQGGMVIASRSGEVYYYPWCSGAAKILPQNQRVFATVTDAKKAGYRAAQNCKGLE